MPPSYVLTDDASGSSSFVLSERTSPLHKSSSSSLSTTGSPKKSKKVLRRRSVDFAPASPSSDMISSSDDAGSNEKKPSTTTGACPVPQTSVYEYDGPTEDEQVEVWYSRDEYDIIKARNNLIIKMMKGGTFKESDEHTFRGLEHKLKDGFKRRRANKFNALNAVLEEQDTQFAKGRPDPDSIAEAYRLVALGAKVQEEGERKRRPWRPRRSWRQPLSAPAQLPVGSPPAAPRPPLRQLRGGRSRRRRQ
jgi:hypothetical protein